MGSVLKFSVMRYSGERQARNFMDENVRERILGVVSSRGYSLCFSGAILSSGQQ